MKNIKLKGNDYYYSPQKNFIIFVGPQRTVIEKHNLFTISSAEMPTKINEYAKIKDIYDKEQEIKNKTELKRLLGLLKEDYV